MRVSAVIPTRYRPELIVRAAESIFKQTLVDLEVIIVIDGPDEMTVEALSAIKDDRLKVIALEENVGGSEARNVGIRAATGKWIALLDDDDEWFPEKLSVQFDAIREKHLNNAIVSCQYVDRKPSGDMIRPQRFPRVNQHLSEYLFCEIGYFRPRQGFLQTSTLLAPRELFLKVPFLRGLKRNQDADWLLRAFQSATDGIYVVPSVLAIFHNEEGLVRIGSKLDWEYSCNWAIGSRQYFTRKSLSYFIAGYCVSVAMRQEPSVSLLFRLFSLCLKHGVIDGKVLCFFLRYSIGTAIIKPLLPLSLLKKIQRIVNK